MFSTAIYPNASKCGIVWQWVNTQQAISPFFTMFSTAIYPSASKCGIVWQWVNTDNVFLDHNVLQQDSDTKGLITKMHYSKQVLHN